MHKVVVMPPNVLLQAPGPIFTVSGRGGGGGGDDGPGDPQD